MKRQDSDASPPSENRTTRSGTSYSLHSLHVARVTRARFLYDKREQTLEKRPPGEATFLPQE
jgi:hypothetical protein